MKFKRLILFFLSLILLGYTAYRAFVLSFTWDEAFTFISFVRKNSWIPHEYNAMSANNHLLNTWLMNLSYHLFGNQEWALRLPNIFAHIVYLYFSAKLCLQFRNTLLVFAGFLLLNINPYLLDFFSLARGYGLSAGLLMAAMYFFYRFLKEKKITDAMLVSLFLILALLAHLTLMIFVIAIMMWLLAGSLGEGLMQGKIEKKNLRKVLYLLFPTGIILSVLIKYSFQLKAADALFYGGESNLWKDTINELVRCSLYDMAYPYFFQSIISFALVCLLAISIVMLFRRFLQNGADLKQIAFHHALADALLFVMLGSLLLNYFFDVKLLTGRTALFLFPLFALLFCFLIDQLTLKKKWLNLSSVIIIILCSAHGLKSMNFTHVLEWKFNSDSKQMLADIQSDERKSIGMEYLYEPSINYYREAKPYPEINKANSADSEEMYSPLHDYYYLSEDKAKPLLEKGLKPLKHYVVSNSYLFKNEEKPELKEWLLIQKSPLQNIYSDIEFSEGISCIIPDSLSEGIISVDARVMTETFLYDVFLVCSIEKQDGSVAWNGVSLADFQRSNQGEVQLYLQAIIPSGGEKAVAYIWNKQKANTILLKDIQLSLQGR